MKHKNDKYNNNNGNGSIHCLKLKYLKFIFASKQFINLQIHRNKRTTISWVSLQQIHAGFHAVSFPSKTWRLETKMWAEACFTPTQWPLGLGYCTEYQLHRHGLYMCAWYPREWIDCWSPRIDIKVNATPWKGLCKSNAIRC